MFKKLSALYALLREDLRILGFALRHPARPAWLVPASPSVPSRLLRWCNNRSVLFIATWHP